MNKQAINAGELVANVVNFIMIKSNTNWYWKEHGNKDSFIIATHIIVNSCLYVATIKDVSDLPHGVYNKTGTKRCSKALNLYLC